MCAQREAFRTNNMATGGGLSGLCVLFQFLLVVEGAPPNLASRLGPASAAV